MQVDHRIPYEILGEQDETDISNFMLLSPSGNRTKSWACEHCKNWIKKDASMCKECYYAQPEDYSHIAGDEERRLDIIFKSKDMHIYEQLRKIAFEENISLQEAFKNFFRKKYKQ